MRQSVSESNSSGSYHYRKRGLSWSITPLCDIIGGWSVFFKRWTVRNHKIFFSISRSWQTRDTSCCCNYMCHSNSSPQRFFLFFWPNLRRHNEGEMTRWPDSMFNTSVVTLFSIRGGHRNKPCVKKSSQWLRSDSHMIGDIVCEGGLYLHCGCQRVCVQLTWHPILKPLSEFFSVGGGCCGSVGATWLCGAWPRWQGRGLCANITFSQGRWAHSNLVPDAGDHRLRFSTLEAAIEQATGLRCVTHDSKGKALRTKLTVKLFLFFLWPSGLIYKEVTEWEELTKNGVIRGQPSPLGE